MPTKAGTPSPLKYHVLPFHSVARMCPVGGPGLCRGWGWGDGGGACPPQDSHSFPAPGGKNRGYSSDNLLLTLLFVLFCPSEKKLPYFNCSSQLPVRLTTLQLATSRVDVSYFFIYPGTQHPNSGDSWRTEQLKACRSTQWKIQKHRCGSKLG